MPFMCRKTVSWLYCASEDFEWASPLRVPARLEFFDSRGVLRLIVEPGGRLIVTQGYAWNGCSPKFRAFDLLIGTPDGAVYEPKGRPKTYFASMVHDALYQFLHTGAPIHRVDADACFLALMTDSEFVLRRVYWLAVRVFGGLAWHGMKRTRKWNGRVRTSAVARSPAA